MKTRHVSPPVRSSVLCALLCAHLSLAAAGCGDGAPPIDASIDAGLDATLTQPDAAPDAPPDAATGCVEATIPGTWSLVQVDDVSAVYRGRIDPLIDTRPWDLYFESLHVFDPDTGGPVDVVGTFELGTGADGNYGTCAHCVIAFYGTTHDRGYFARAGTRTVAEDPFELGLDVVIEDLEHRRVPPPAVSLRRGDRDLRTGPRPRRRLAHDRREHPGVAAGARAALTEIAA